MNTPTNLNLCAFWYSIREEPFCSIWKVNTAKTLRHFLPLITHRSRKYAEDKTKVVAAVLGTEFIQFLAALAISHQDDLKNKMNSSFSSYHPGAIHSFLHMVQNKWCVKKLKEFCPPSCSDDLCLVFCIYPSSSLL